MESVGEKVARREWFSSEKDSRGRNRNTTNGEGIEKCMQIRVELLDCVLPLLQELPQIQFGNKLMH